MPQLKNREKRLLYMLGGILLILGNYLLWEKLFHTKKQIEEDRKNLKFQIIETEIWMKQRDEANSKKEWIQNNQPTLTVSPGEASSSLLELATKTATEHKLAISKNDLGKTVSTAIYEEVSVNLVLTGPMEAIIKWAHNIYSPEEFRLFKNFDLGVEKTQKVKGTMELKVTVAQWFKPTGTADLATTE